ncbi:MAG: hypothetical protein JNG89_03565 [Planctomycetaceae bacterium]|nr:hypothetical protein [Planctomycetaceae bacterium]
MTRRELLTRCVAGSLAGSFVVAPPLAWSQQPQAPGRARVQAAPPAGATQGRTPPAQGDAPQQQQRPERPAAELQMPAELEQLLVDWERESSKIKRLHGMIKRYTYDSVYSVEKRAIGEFWYQDPDQGRIDFGPGDLKEAAAKKGANGQVFTVQAETAQQWICTGKQIFLIDVAAEMYDKIDIPAQQQGRNIMNGPLPFLFGMKAEQAKQRDHLSLGSRHWPQGNVQKLPDGTERRSAPQFHVVAVPKLEVDAREWCRAEVQLDGRTFIPTAIRLINPQQSAETVYVLPLREMKANERVWIINPFNHRPPSQFRLGEDSRATSDATPVGPPK